jgi:carbonic anhydrase/acetyltransferase-like protein (isoleucine patch superfamily)
MPLYALDEHLPAVPDDGRYYIAPGAHVIGRVTLGVDSGIWFGAVLRGDNEPIVIGDRSNVQENAVLHVDPGYPMKIGNDCTIGHGVVLHGCTIGDGCLIGMGATIMNGAKFGAGSIVGANALITENKEFPERSLIVGAPAKAIKALPPDNNFIGEAASYVKKANRYRAGLKPAPSPEEDPVD